MLQHPQKNRSGLERVRGKTVTVAGKEQAEVAQQHAHLIPDLALMARNAVRDLNPQVNFNMLSPL